MVLLFDLNILVNFPDGHGDGGQRTPTKLPPLILESGLRVRDDPAQEASSLHLPWKDCRAYQGTCHIPAEGSRPSPHIPDVS